MLLVMLLLTHCDSNSRSYIALCSSPSASRARCSTSHSYRDYSDSLTLWICCLLSLHYVQYIRSYSFLHHTHALRTNLRE